ncbi:MAG: DUF2177 family protein [Hyphomicrobium sp.]|nr:DUF2177 family protein [Hyphomicrobium sp.]
MTKYIIAYLATAAAMVVLDVIWLGYIAAALYKSEMGGILADPINVPAAVAFYALYVVGIVIFAVNPGLEGNSIGKAALMGAMFGFFCYATYDLTGLAVIRDFPWRLAMIDIAWGTILTSISAAAGTAAVMKLT